ncbi:MAG: hypothetical protein PUC11_01150 [Elusimicrobia bacterium]|nr:hypothetical protein [Elusimicrobiota bacterium]
MFKLKPGNVFQKLNKMDKKQAYTWGAIVVVCFIALITLASFLDDADDASFDGFNTRGYDLAQMPFVNDEAEEYLLASKYPDMKNNGSTMLYSQAEKEARQEADAEAGADSEEASSSNYNSSSSGGYSGRGYTGGGRSGTGTPTQVGQLGSASMGHAGGSGMSGTFGAPRGDFSPYKSQEKGSEIQTQLKNTDARRALSQFAQTSRAAAGLKDNKNANAKRALMGGSIRGSEAFTDSGVDLSKTAGLELDTNAPVSSADLSNLDKAVSDGAKDAKDDNDQDKQDLSDKLLEQFLSGLVNLGIQALGGLVDKGLNAAFGAIDAAGARSGVDNNMLDHYEQLTEGQWNSLKNTPEGDAMMTGLQSMGKLDSEGNWNANQPTRDQMRSNLKSNRGSINDFTISRSGGSDEPPTYTMNIGASNETLRSEKSRESWAASMGRSFIDTHSLTQNNNNNNSSNSYNCAGNLTWQCTGTGDQRVCKCQ